MRKYTFLLLLLFFGCKKNPTIQQEISADTENKNLKASERGHLQMGDAFAGGIVFYFSDKAHKHGLVCSPVDVGNYPWDLTTFDPQNPNSYNPVYVSGTGTSLGTGYSNTTTIISALGQGNYAANICRSYNGGGFNDWSLPSKDELNIVYQNLKVTGLAIFSSTNLSYYWSSSEIDFRAVWCQRFDDGVQVDFAWKNNLMNVRAIRVF